MSTTNPQIRTRVPMTLRRGGPAIRSSGNLVERSRIRTRLPQSGGVVNFRERRINQNNQNIIRPRIIRRRRIIRRSNFQNNFFPNQNNRRMLNYRRLFISGIGNILNNNQLYNIFSVYGRLARCNINYDIMGRSKGNANVDFVLPQDARRAINYLNGAKIGRGIMTVRFDRNRFFRRNYFRKNRNFNFRRIAFRRRNFRRFNIITRRRNLNARFNRRIAFRRRF